MGKIHAALNETGLLARTFLIWTSDHGDGQGDHYHWRKGYPYEFSAHVPMLLRWPEAWAATRRVTLPRGAVLEPPIVTELRDVFHTLVDAAGLAGTVARLHPAFDAADGKSMLCLLEDPSGQACDYAPNPGYAASRLEPSTRAAEITATWISLRRSSGPLRGRVRERHLPHQGGEPVPE